MLKIILIITSLQSKGSGERTVPSDHPGMVLFYIAISPQQLFHPPAAGTAEKMQKLH